jgi:exonuclease SbcC
MIPIALSLSGFLSYHDPVEIDFSLFDLACISGPNGAGKSSLLDAITWALFGQARKRDDSLINAQSNTAEVSLTFAYEQNTYRVLRSKTRDKTMQLEFQLSQDGGSAPIKGSSGGQWKSLSGHSLRETEALIEKTLRLDYDTFVNASFFLQGKADQFTQQRPGDRKRILSSILGLEIWEAYRQGAVERRRGVEDEIGGLDGQLREIHQELAEESARRARLAQLEADLKRRSQERKNQERLVENIRKIAAALAEQEKAVEAQRRYLESTQRSLDEQQKRLANRRGEQATYITLVSRGAEIEAAYAAWTAARQELAHQEEIAGRFREHEKRRNEPRQAIQEEQAALQKELQLLLKRGEELQGRLAEVETLKSQLAAAQEHQAALEAALEQRPGWESQIEALRSQQPQLKAENLRLKEAMTELKERIDELSQVEGALCPLCGQPLSPAERQNLIASLQVQGTQMGDRHRQNQKSLLENESQVSQLEAALKELRPLDSQLRGVQQQALGAASRLELLERQQADWQASEEKRIQELTRLLEREAYALEARRRLAEIDEELRQIGYDPGEHDRARAAELAGQPAEAELRTLEAARAALAPLEREIAELAEACSALAGQVAEQQEEYAGAAQSLAAARSQAPDLEQADALLLDLQEQENILRSEVGAARQRVDVLERQRERHKTLSAQREDLARQAGLYRQLEKAFSKDGVPALLIEQALPQIEAKANEVLDRLSGGSMAVRFVTQSAYKDKRREDLRETLDIQISDGAGGRDYEMFSGGEAFRVNFAVRLALSEVLAQRAGARLQTLVIDEGFGSQDAQGRQRLIEAINLVRQDFAKILVITHIDELKDAFPNRIEVEKSASGSTLRVL